MSVLPRFIREIMNDTLTIKYECITQDNNIEDIAECIAVEATVEMPKEAIQDSSIIDRFVGKVEYIEQQSEDKYTVSVNYSVAITNNRINQLLNLLYGNISYYTNIRIVDLILPTSFIQNYAGPNYSVDRLRAELKVPDRPLTAAVLKPIGSSPKYFSEVSYHFTKGGIDLIKDDHSLGDHPFCSFEDRINSCLASIHKARQESGSNTLYIASVTGDYQEIRTQIEQAIKKGVNGILLHPYIVGIDFCHGLIKEYGEEIFFVAHLTQSGVFHQNNQGVSLDIILGSMLRIIGFDVVNVPHYQGRLTITQEECSSVQTALQKPYHNMKKTWIMPGGGVSIPRLEELKDAIRQTYSRDTIALIGGSLYDYSENLQHNAAIFKESMESLIVS